MTKQIIDFWSGKAMWSTARKRPADDFPDVTVAPRRMPNACTTTQWQRKR